MAKAKLIVNDEQEITPDGVISIGRASDNVISLSNDTNISRYHAEIEKRGEEFWLIELGSSNGTMLNGYSVTTERVLKDGDVIMLGGSSEIRFETEKEETKNPAPEASVSAVPPPEAKSENSAEKAIAADTEKVSKLPLILGIMGVLCGLAVICVVVVVIVSLNSTKTCEASAVISNLDSGETLSEETDVQARITNGGCVGRAIFVLDGQEFASADSEPYKVSLNPGDFGDFDGGLHSLRVVLEDKEGNKIEQPNEVLLAFETLATPTPTPEDTPEVKTTQTQQKKTQSKEAFSATEMPDAVRQVAKQFPANAVYRYDPQFLQEVSKRTAEYAVEGYFARAQNYSDKINEAYLKEQNLDPPIGYLLALSRSKFNPQKQGAEEGLWRMTNDFATANSLNGMCGTETLSDPSQNCAVRVSALYMKNILLNVFEGDVIYSVAAFGMSPQEAAAWKATLPADRKDFWNIIKSPKQREEVAKFFAASIVAENPQKFGLKKDRPLSELYKNLMGN